MGNAWLTLLVMTLLVGCSSGVDKHAADVGQDVGTDASMDLGTDAADLSQLPPGGLIITPDMAQMSENGGTASLNISLAVTPASDVVVTIESADTTEVVASGPLTFTSGNWSTEQLVVLTGVDDDCFDGTQQVDVTVHAQGAANYANLASGSVAVSVLDDDAPASRVSPAALTVTEGGAGQSFTVRLVSDSCSNGVPSGPVTIPVSVSDATQLEVAVDELIFTPENFDTPQDVLVTAVNDALVEPEQQHAVVFGAASGGGYDGFDPADVAVTVLSDDDPVFTVAPQAIQTNEFGGMGTFDVSLSPTPTVPVVIVPTGDPTEGLIAPTSFTFDPANPGPATFTVTGFDDGDCGTVTYQITLEASSTDPGFDALAVPPVAVTNLDGDTCYPGASVTPQSLTVSEGQSATFTIALSGRPDQTVTIDLTPSAADVNVVPDLLSFDDTNYGTPQLITVTALDNTIVEGNRALVVETTMTATGNYLGVDPADVYVLVIDND